MLFKGCQEELIWRDDGDSITLTAISALESATDATNALTVGFQSVWRAGTRPEWPSSTGTLMSLSMRLRTDIMSDLRLSGSLTLCSIPAMKDQHESIRRRPLTESDRTIAT